MNNYQTKESKRKYLQSLLERSVQIDSDGRLGRITNVTVTSDGFIIGHTSPGYDRGVFIGRAPWRVQ